MVVQTLAHKEVIIKVVQILTKMSPQPSANNTTKINNAQLRALTLQSPRFLGYLHLLQLEGLGLRGSGFRVEGFRGLGFGVYGRAVVVWVIIGLKLEF